MKTSVILAVCSAFALVAVGCGDDGARPVDSGPDIMLDSGPDVDGGGDVDAGPDTDSGTPTSCDVGDACNPDRGCPRSPRCIAQTTYAVGTAGTDEIQGHPDGDTTIPDLTSWQDGYCTTVGTASTGGCDPNDDDSCGGLDCAVCLNAGQDPSSGETVTFCVGSCTPSLTENTCRDGYNCALGSSGCVPGCTTDDECAVYREDTNEDGAIDDGPAEGGADRLVYDTDGNWTCNAATYRCEHEGAAEAEAGDVCVKDTDCEARGSCLDEAGTEGGWPEGYCFKLGCDVAGNECAGAGVCNDRAFGIPVCLSSCEVGSTVDTEDIFSASTECRAGYSCFWDGESAAGADSGVCIPGNYNDVTEPNVGDECGGGETPEATCYSPFGLGQCRDWDGDDGRGNAVCTMFDCGAPGMPEGVCGDGAVCSGVMGSSTTLCLNTCESGDDCAPGYGCYPGEVAGLVTTEKVCFAGCPAPDSTICTNRASDPDLADCAAQPCKTDETCNMPDPMMIGECVAS